VCVCVQGCELGRHWRRHCVQDADGCYSCSACSFTSNVRLIMHSHAHVHLVRRRAGHASQPRCRICARSRICVGSRRRLGWPVKVVDDGGMVRSLWCSDCARRLASSRLLHAARRRRRHTDAAQTPTKPLRRPPVCRFTRRKSAADGDHVEN